MTMTMTMTMIVVVGMAVVVGMMEVVEVMMGHGRIIRLHTAVTQLRSSESLATGGAPARLAPPLQDPFPNVHESIRLRLLGPAQRQ